MTFPFWFRKMRHRKQQRLPYSLLWEQLSGICGFFCFNKNPVGLERIFCKSSGNCWLQNSNLGADVKAGLCCCVLQWPAELSQVLSFQLACWCLWCCALMSIDLDWIYRLYILLVVHFNTSIPPLTIVFGGNNLSKTSPRASSSLMRVNMSLTIRPWIWDLPFCQWQFPATMTTLMFSSWRGSFHFGLMYSPAGSRYSVFHGPAHWASCLQMFGFVFLPFGRLGPQRAKECCHRWNAWSDMFVALLISPSAPTTFLKSKSSCIADGSGSFGLGCVSRQTSHCMSLAHSMTVGIGFLRFQKPLQTCGIRRNKMTFCSSTCQNETNFNVRNKRLCLLASGITCLKIGISNTRSSLVKVNKYWSLIKSFTFRWFLSGCLSFCSRWNPEGTGAANFLSAPPQL